MKHVLVLCDGARAPTALQPQAWDKTLVLNHRGPRANVNLHLQSPTHILLSALDDHAADLIRLAAYVYAADQSVSRGGEADVYGDDWHREFTLCIAVSDPDFWQSQPVFDALQEVLNFASDDYWNFSFCAGLPEQRLLIELDPQTSLGDPDSVFLFSGGMDSLCAVAEAALLQGKHPLLLGHSPANHVGARQKRVATGLQTRFGHRWHFPYQSVAIHRTGTDPADYTQRTRSFLFAALGTAIADRLHVPEVALSDNGVVSLNLHMNDQLIGGKASRSTHPLFLHLFNLLTKQTLRTQPRLFNPLWSRTRAETLQILKDAGAVELLEETSSCSHGRFLTSARRHCGVCSQCIDRRFATIIAGLEEADPPDGYDVDIFTGHIREGNSRVMATSYYQFACSVADLDDDAFFYAFTELFRCVIPNEPEQERTTDALIAMLHRHGRSVVKAMADQIGRLRDQLARQQLPETCLTRLVVASQKPEPSAAFQPGPDYREVRSGDQWFTLTPNQARVFELMHRHHKQGSTALSQEYILEELDIRSRNLYQVFRGSSVWGKLIVPATGNGMFRLNI